MIHTRRHSRPAASPVPWGPARADAGKAAGHDDQPSPPAQGTPAATSAAAPAPYSVSIGWWTASPPPAPPATAPPPPAADSASGESEAAGVVASAGQRQARAKRAAEDHARRGLGHVSRALGLPQHHVAMFGSASSSPIRCGASIGRKAISARVSRTPDPSALTSVTGLPPQRRHQPWRADARGRSSSSGSGVAAIQTPPEDIKGAKAGYGAHHQAPLLHRQILALQPA